MASETDISTDRRLVIHCGVQKTGSTSLHHFLARNRATLNDQMMVFTPRKGSLTRDLGRAAVRFSLDISAKNRDLFHGAVCRLRDEMVNGTTPILLSHENILGAMIGNGDTTTLYPRLQEILAVLTDGFAPLRPEFVVYTREMNDWKHSVYGQAVRSDRYAGTLCEFLDETRDCGTWQQLHDRMSELIGPDRIRFFRLEDETDEKRPAAQLLGLMGWNASDVSQLTPIDGRRNRSLNPGALEFLRLVNGLGLERGARRRVAELVTDQQSLFVSGLA